LENGPRVSSFDEGKYLLVGMSAKKENNMIIEYQVINCETLEV